MVAGDGGGGGGCGLPFVSLCLVFSRAAQPAHTELLGWAGLGWAGLGWAGESRFEEINLHINCY